MPKLVRTLRYPGAEILPVPVYASLLQNKATEENTEQPASFI